MNKIVREQFAVESLPEELRPYFKRGKPVTITVEQDAAPEPGPLTRFADLRAPETRLTNAGVTSDEAVARIRALRDEWDD